MNAYQTLKISLLSSLILNLFSCEAIRNPSKSSFEYCDYVYPEYFEVQLDSRDVYLCESDSHQITNNELMPKYKSAMKFYESKGTTIRLNETRFYNNGRELLLSMCLLSSALPEKNFDLHFILESIYYSKNKKMNLKIKPKIQRNFKSLPELQVDYFDASIVENIFNTDFKDNILAIIGKKDLEKFYNQFQVQFLNREKSQEKINLEKQKPQHRFPMNTSCKIGVENYSYPEESLKYCKVFHSGSEAEYFACSTGVIYEEYRKTKSKDGLLNRIIQLEKNISKETRLKLQDVIESSRDYILK